MQGFLKAYDSVRAKVMAVSDEVMCDEPCAWQVSVTGHSLGGALATLCSYELANRRCVRQSSMIRSTPCLQQTSISHRMGGALSHVVLAA